MDLLDGRMAFMTHNRYPAVDVADTQLSADMGATKV